MNLLGDLLVLNLGLLNSNWQLIVSIKVAVRNYLHLHAGAIEIKILPPLTMILSVKHVRQHFFLQCLVVPTCLVLHGDSRQRELRFLERLVDAARCVAIICIVRSSLSLSLSLSLAERAPPRQTQALRLSDLQVRVLSSVSR